VSNTPTQTLFETFPRLNQYDPVSLLVLHCCDFWPPDKGPKDELRSTPHGLLEVALVPGVARRCGFDFNTARVTSR
jgi:hypothetical protein